MKNPAKASYSGNMSVKQNGNIFNDSSINEKGAKSASSTFVHESTSVLHMQHASYDFCILLQLSYNCSISETL